MALQDLVLHQKRGHPNSCFSERGHSRQVWGKNNINKIKNLPEHAGKPSKPSALGQSLRDPPELQAHDGPADRDILDSFCMKLFSRVCGAGFMG